MQPEPASFSVMDEHLKNYIDQRDTVVEQKIKIWIMTSIIAQVVTILPVIFFLGGIYQNVNSSLNILKDQSDVSVNTVARVQGLEDRQRELRAWAKTKGFIPFTPDPKP